MHVELEWLAAEVMAELPTADGRDEVRALIADVLRCPELWPAPGGEELADVFGGSCWVTVVAYLDGIEVRDIGWCG
ncbi:hypothetical protein ACIOHC_11195 [Streptomyces sp. NPDC088252]|uniref:hypothetical protein n=1 Tax=unclassified Streptomyces TaxID=2593676 RepID=UPI003827758B